eukprot:RCo043636
MYATVIGAGIVGLSVAARVSQVLRPKGLDVLLLDKYPQFGMETSSHNSEVIHASIYYKKGSLKALLCSRGNDLMYEICKAEGVPFTNHGKLIVATDANEASRLPALLNLAVGAGAKKVRVVTREEAKSIEPSVECTGALWCPTSGVVDTHQLMQLFEGIATQNGTSVLYGNKVVGVQKVGDEYVLQIQAPDKSVSTFNTKLLINCAGHGAPLVTKMLGIDTTACGYDYHPTRAVYYRVNKKVSKYPKALVYPMPAPGVVGIHTCPDVAGGMRLGPWDQWVDYNPEHLDYSVPTGLEKFFADSVKKFLPFVEPEDLSPDSTGFHPKYQRKDQDIQDFIIRHEKDKGFPNFINLIGIESPGVTASPAIGEYVAKMVSELVQ